MLSKELTSESREDYQMPVFRAKHLDKNSWVLDNQI